LMVGSQLRSRQETKQENNVSISEFGCKKLIHPHAAHCLDSASDDQCEQPNHRSCGPSENVEFK